MKPRPARRVRQGWYRSGNHLVYNAIAKKRPKKQKARKARNPGLSGGKPRFLADGPGPGGSWSKGWPSNPGLTGAALIVMRTRKAKQRARERNEARIGLEPLYDALEALSGAIEKLVSQRVIDNRKRKKS